MRKAVLFLVALCLVGRLSAETDPGITLHWYPRPPMQYVENGKLHGIVIDPTISAFKTAGIPIHWHETPASRILAVIRANQGMDCSPGWYKTPEREAFGQYTLPILHDSGLVVVVRQGLFIGAEKEDAASFLKTPGLRILWKQDFSYGPFFGKLVPDLVPVDQIIKTSADMPIILKMIQAGRADATIVSREEIDYLSRSMFAPTEFRELAFRDSPPGGYRHILCSRNVPAEIIVRLNSAIAK